jgi:predicted GIY-YIG superfamily endonuclease
MSATLYRYYDNSAQLLYVGITGDNTKRQAQHRRGSFWFGEIASATFEHFEDRALALSAESVAIRNEKPKHNIQGAERREPTRWLIDLPSKMHLFQLVADRIGDQDEIHRDWARELQSWMHYEDCWGCDTWLDAEEHLAWHLYDLKCRYKAKRRPKFLAHEHCEQCSGIFTSEWYSEKAQNAIDALHKESEQA